MIFVVGSATLVALVLLVLTATVGNSTQQLRPLRRHAYVLCFAIAGLVTAADVASLVGLLVPSLVLYEIAAAVAG